MYKLIIILIFSILVSCSGETNKEATITTTDTLMDSTTLKMKADTTVNILNKLEDSINNLRLKAADKAE